MLHGHTHGKRGLITGPDRMDIGWDNFGRPVEINEVMDLFNASFNSY